MVLEKQKQAVILSTGEGETIEMSLDKSSEQLIMQMFGKSMYSDPEGSIVREWASNGVDSHRRSNCKDPVIVSLVSALDDNYEFTVEDFGTGLSAHEVTTVISQYGNSTKRGSNNEIGGWGIGFKSGLAYSSVFYFVCRKDGIENKYMMYEGEFKNNIDLLYSKETSERNGVKMILPVKKCDFNIFLSKIKEQLCYFENVYFNIPGDYHINKFTILRSDDYQISSLCSSNNLHMCLDDVYYPIDFAKLGIPLVQFPIGLRFKLSDGVFPIPNREQIQYTAKSKQIILKKLEKVATQIVQKYNAEIKNLQTIKELVNYCEHSINVLKLNETNCAITTIESYSTKSVEVANLKEFKHLSFLDLYYNAKHHLIKDFELCHILYEDSLRKPPKNFSNFTLYDILLKNKDVIYLVDMPITFKQKQYIKDIAAFDKKVYFIKVSTPRKLGNKLKRYDYMSYYNLLSLGNYKKSEWRNLIKDFQSFIQVFKKDYCINISDVIVPKTFTEKIKKERFENKKKKVVKVAGQISAKQAVEYVHDFTQCKFIAKTLTLENITKTKNFIVYSDADHIQYTKCMFSTFRSVSFMILNSKELEIVKNLKYHNFISMEEFKKGNSKQFKRIVTAWLIENLVSKHKNIFANYSIISKSSKTLAKDLEMLNSYQQNCLMNSRASDSIKGSMIAVAVKNNLFDFSVYHDYLRVKTDLESLQYVEDFLSIASTYTRDQKSLVKTLNILFKYDKRRINIEHYNTKLHNI